MNHYKARELYKKDGCGTKKWHYTCMNNSSIWAVGYCSPWKTCPTCGGESPTAGKSRCPTCDNKYVVRSDDPCPGHDTPEEAEEHYKQYLMDKLNIRGPKTHKWPKEKCDLENCEHEAEFVASVRGSTSYQLCSNHANRETVEVMFQVGESWSS